MVETSEKLVENRDRYVIVARGRVRGQAFSAGFHGIPAQ
jgi:hypothetical protein